MMKLVSERTSDSKPEYPYCVAIGNLCYWMQTLDAAKRYAKQYGGRICKQIYHTEET